ncbi:MAG: hypothetical protein HY819_12460 [Acidobacteria bacterium]|nr:hypothetical protein [Acidobacteriota bacterium]
MDNKSKYAMREILYFLNSTERKTKTALNKLTNSNHSMPPARDFTFYNVSEESLPNLQMIYDWLVEIERVAAELEKSTKEKNSELY